MEDSVNKLEAMFNKTESDIDYLSRKLDAQCSNLSDKSKSVNPAEILKNVDEIKKEYGSIKNEALEIQNAQKEAMEFMRDQLTSLYTAVSSLQQATAIHEEKPAELDRLQSILGIPALSNTSEVSSSASSATSSTSNPPPPEQTDTSQNKKMSMRQLITPCSDTRSTSSSRDIPATPAASGVIYDQNENKPPELSAYERRRASDDLIEVEEHEFMSVSSLVRGRVKLTDVNQTYRILWNHFKVENNSEPLNNSSMHKIGLRVTGHTGEAKLKVLRALKLLSISSKGDVLLL